jgi:hypothetical protein
VLGGRTKGPKEKIKFQINLFDTLTVVHVNKTVAWTSRFLICRSGTQEMLAFEKETLGFYITDIRFPLSEAFECLHFSRFVHSSGEG